VLVSIVTRSDLNHNHFRSEFRYGSFQRVIPLPAKVQNQQVKADLKDGILTLTLPSYSQSRTSKVNLGQSQPAAASIELVMITATLTLEQIRLLKLLHKTWSKKLIDS